jgi:hypothetical protein
MDNSNEERLKLLIGFINGDVAPDMGNVEKAAAEFLKLNASLVLGMADALDELKA